MRRGILVLTLVLLTAACAGTPPRNDPSAYGERQDLTKEDLGSLKSPAPVPDDGVAAAGQSGALRTYFVPFGDFPMAELSRAETFAEGLKVPVTILPAVPLSDSIGDPRTGQIVGERMLQAMVERYPKYAGDYSVALIGFTQYDMRLDSMPEWGWAFGKRMEGHLGVISVARMTLGTSLGSALFRERVRKMTGRYLGLLSFQKPFNSDPRSMLFSDLLGVDDLDRMQERF